MSPILVTALVTGIGLVPLALGAGEPGKEIQQPTTVVILGGVVTPTALNMIVIPALYLKLGRGRAECRQIRREQIRRYQERARAAWRVASDRDAIAETPLPVA